MKNGRTVVFRLDGLQESLELVARLRFEPSRIIWKIRFPSELRIHQKNINYSSLNSFDWGCLIFSLLNSHRTLLMNWLSIFDLFGCGLKCSNAILSTLSISSAVNLPEKRNICYFDRILIAIQLFLRWVVLHQSINVFHAPQNAEHPPELIFCGACAINQSGDVFDHLSQFALLEYVLNQSGSIDFCH